MPFFFSTAESTGLRITIDPFPMSYAAFRHIEEKEKKEKEEERERKQSRIFGIKITDACHVILPFASNRATAVKRIAHL